MTDINGDKMLKGKNEIGIDNEGFGKFHIKIDANGAEMPKDNNKIGTDNENIKGSKIDRVDNNDRDLIKQETLAKPSSEIGFGEIYITMNKNVQGMPNNEMGTDNENIKGSNKDRADNNERDLTKQETLAVSSEVGELEAIGEIHITMNENGGGLSTGNNTAGINHEKGLATKKNGVENNDSDFKQQTTFANTSSELGFSNFCILMDDDDEDGMSKGANETCTDNNNNVKTKKNKADNNNKDFINQVTLAKALTEVGEFGRFQKFLCVIFFLTALPVVMQMLLTVFLTTTPEWKCRQNSTTCRDNRTAFPANDVKRCDLPRDSWEYIGEKEFSLTTYFEIDCASSWMLMMLSSLVFFGWGIGAVFIGYIADNFGRRTILIPSFISVLLLGSIETLLPNIYLIMVTRFLIGFCLQGTVNQGLIIISEITGAKHRPVANISILAATGIGWCMMAVQAYLVPHWKHFILTCTLPYFLLIPALFLVPESIEWLQIQGKDDPVLDVLRRMAKYNGREFPNNLTLLKEDHKIVSNKTSPADLFKTWKEAFKTLRVSYVWIVIMMGSFGLYIAANQLGGSLYRDFAIISILELPGVPISILICRKFGGRSCVIYPLLIGSTICIITGLIPKDADWLAFRVTFGIVGSFFFNLTIGGLHVWTIELFQTRVRSTAMGFVALTTRISSGIAPWIVGELEPYGDWCTFVALGVPSLIGYFVAFSLPETRVKKQHTPPPAQIARRYRFNMFELIVKLKKESIQHIG